MSQSCGAAGAYGILLSASELPAIVEVREKIKQIVDDFPVREPGEAAEFDTPEDYPGVEELIEPLKQAFRDSGIAVPEEADLLWTGSEDDQPARCATDPNDWVLGFGLFTRPDNFPKMDPTFLAASEWHTWVWQG